MSEFYLYKKNIIMHVTVTNLLWVWDRALRIRLDSGISFGIDKWGRDRIRQIKYIIVPTCKLNL